MIEIVSATRFSETDFWNKSALGLSLRRLRYDRRLVPRIAVENRRGLPEVFNARLLAQDSADLLVFVHDDVWIDDYFLADHIIEGLRTYDVLGVAGNRRRVPNQRGWAFIDHVDGKFVWDAKANLSGSIGHGKTAAGAVSYYGPLPADCELLDGVFMAASKPLLKARSVAFDTRFDFHFYDIDFCRSARQAGLRLGTWPICLTHQSGGAFGSESWHQRYRAYIDKWGD